MQKLAVVFLGFILLQCSSSPDNEISLFNNIVYHLEEGESVENITPGTVLLYDSLFNGPKAQIPLFRSIGHEDYTIFIGLPFNTTYNQLLESKTKHSDTADNFQIITDSCFFSKYHVESGKVAEYLVQLEENSLVFVAALSNTSFAPDSLFTLKKFHNRISQK